MGQIGLQEGHCHDRQLDAIKEYNAKIAGNYVIDDWVFLKISYASFSFWLSYFCGPLSSEMFFMTVRLIC